MAGPRIVLATVGSLGDLHPFVAIALALRERGADPVLAVPEDHLSKCRAAGVEAAAILPGFDEVGQATGLPNDEIVARVLASGDFLLRRILLPPLGDSVDRLLGISRGADLILGSGFTFAAPIAAERLGIPYINVLLQPMSWFSALDPPTGSRVPIIAPPPTGRIGAAWNKTLLAAAKRFSQARYGGAINRVRRAHGLPPSSAAPLIEPGTRPALSIGAYSPVLGPPPADAPRPAIVTGFPWFDSETGEPSVSAPELARFLAEGPPPLVVSLGSFVPHSTTRFYECVARVAASLGMRAVLLVGKARATPTPAPDLLILPYAPHSLLFPHARAVIHHGGIGTTGQALRSGRPQLVVPFMGDQFDNAARVKRLGAGLSFRDRDDDAALRRAVRALIDEPRFAATACELGTTIAAEDGAGRAADAILRAVQDRPRP